MTTEQQIEKEADDYCQVNNGLKIKDYNIELRRIHKAYIAGRTKGIVRERELEDGLRLFLKVINRSDTALEYYGDAIANAEQLLNH